MEKSIRDGVGTFPEEVWTIIFEQLKKDGNSQDVLNCSNVCSDFERILKPTKKEWLFETVCASIFPYLKGYELLACRGVCKTWRRDVDRYIQNFETWRPFSEGSTNLSRSCRYNPLRYKGIRWTEILCEAKLNFFMEAMKTQQFETPFIARSLSIADRVEWDGPVETELYQKSAEMFTLYGREIWYLNMLYSSPISRLPQVLGQILDNTANLKYLMLFVDTRSDPTMELEDHLQGAIDWGEKLSKFETLGIYCTTSTPLTILETLSSKIKLDELKVLELYSNYSYAPQPCTVMTPLCSLTELHIVGITWHDLQILFRNLTSHTPPLARISMDILLFNEGGDYFGQLIEFISLFKKTLRMLTIKGDGSSVLRPTVLPSLDSVGFDLKSFDLDGIVIETSLLLHAFTNSLEYLHVCYSGPLADDGQGRDFDKCVFEDESLHTSLLWDNMKKLKVFTVDRILGVEVKKKVICTREMHDFGIKAKVCDINYYDDVSE